MPSPRSSLSQQSHRKCHTCRIWRSCIVTLFTYLFKKTSECLPACDPQLGLLVRNTVYSRQTDGKLWKNPNAHVRGCYWSSAILVSKCLGVCASVCVCVLPWWGTSSVIVLQPDVLHVAQWEGGGQQEQVNGSSLKDTLVGICECMNVALSLWATQLQGDLQDTNNGSISLHMVFSPESPGWQKMEAIVAQLENKKRLTLAVVPAFLRWPVWTLIR